MGRGFLKRRLRDKLTPEELKALSSSFDVVGDIAIIKVPPSLEGRRALIAEAVMAANKNVRTVLSQVSPVKGGLRLRGLEWVAGEEKTVTVHREYGCAFRVDLAKVYFSPRLSFERMRVARLVKPGEVVVNMFAGVGCFSVMIAKHSEAGRVYSIDINPEAVRLMGENISLNRVEALYGDAREVVERRLRNVADRVLMPLPEKACEYLDAALLALKSGRGIIHYYDFVHAGKGERPVGKTVERVRERMEGLGRNFDVVSSRVVRTIGPNWHQVVLDIEALP